MLLERLNLFVFFECRHKRQMIEYFLIRQEFIYPTFLPPICESFLRDDFNMSEYFTIALSKTTKKVFKMSFSSFLLFVILCTTWILLTMISISVQVLLLFSKCKQICRLSWWWFSPLLSLFSSRFFTSKWEEYTLNWWTLLKSPMIFDSRNSMSIEIR